MARQDARPPGISATQTARSILAAIQGGVVILQATGRIAYLESALDLAMAPLAAASPVSA
jgi:hypothetical protein